LSSSPVNEAVFGIEMFPVTKRTPVPVKDGTDAWSAASPVLTVTFAPFVGRVPASQVNDKVSSETEAVNSGRVPTVVILFTVVVSPGVLTLIVGALTFPCGV
jgi:ABC-type methionine transport system permease subunit